MYEAINLLIYQSINLSIYQSINVYLKSFILCSREGGWEEWEG